MIYRCYLLVALLLSFWSNSYAQNGKVIPFYQPHNNPNYEQMWERLISSHAAENMALLANFYKFRRDLKVGYGICNQPNAFYNPKASSITICAELLDVVREKVDLLKVDEQKKSQIRSHIVTSIFFHELAHALIDINKIPITGREEDVADQFSAYMEIEHVERKRPEIQLIPATVYFWKNFGGEVSLRAMANEHSLSPQRAFNIACWAKGAGMPSADIAIRIVNLPSERIERCAAEYQRLVTGINTLFLPWRR